MLTYYIYNPIDHFKLPRFGNTINLFYNKVTYTDAFHKLYFEDKKWKEIYGKKVTYSNYQDLSEIKNRVSNSEILCTKKNLYENIKGKYYCLPFVNFIISDKEKILKEIKLDDKVWFLKKNNIITFGGYDVFPIKADKYFMKNVNKYIAESNENKKYKSEEFSLQEGVENPKLIDGKKFDLRIYVLLTYVDNDSTFHLFTEGLIRKTLKKYDKNDLSKGVQLTNTTLNRKELNESEIANNLTEKFWYNHVLYKYYTKIKDICKDICLIYKDKFDYQKGYHLFGFDFIIDQNDKIYVLEVNKSPQLHYKSELIEGIHHSLEYHIFSEFYKITISSIVKKTLLKKDTTYYDYLC